MRVIGCSSFDDVNALMGSSFYGWSVADGGRSNLRSSWELREDWAVRQSAWDSRVGLILRKTKMPREKILAFSHLRPVGESHLGGKGIPMAK